MNSKRLWASAAVCLLVSPAFGRGYPKLDLPRNEIAILTNDKTTPLEIMKIDGVPVGGASHGEYQLRPGKHTVMFYFLYQAHRRTYESGAISRTFLAEAGGELKLSCDHVESKESLKHNGDEYNPNGGSFRYWILDTATGSTVPFIQP